MLELGVLNLRAVHKSWLNDGSPSGFVLERYVDTIHISTRTNRYVIEGSGYDSLCAYRNCYEFFWDRSFG